jgi:hypothetical protein
MVVTAWLLIVGEVYVFFDVILVYAPPIHTVGSLTLVGLLKVGATVGLGVLWFVVVSALAKLYTTSKTRPRAPRPSS